MKTILLISPYWREEHRWMVSSYKMADLWQQLGYKVIVVCMAKEAGVEEVSPTLTIHRRKDFFLKDPWNYGIALGFSGYVRKLVKKIDPDIIVVNKLLFWSSFATIPLRLSGKKVLVLTDALVGMTWWPRGRIPKICAAIYAWTGGWLILLSAWKVVTFHPQPPSLLRKLLIKKKTQIIPTGIDPSPYRAEPNPPAETVTISYVGRLESVKGVEDYAAAIAAIKEDYPHVKAQIVGWYKEGHPLVTKYQRHIAFTGLRKDIPDVLAATDIFVLPSYSEGLSNALMEAMSSSCACVASEVGGNGFLIQNGVSGFLFPPGDREALHAHLRRLLDDSSKRVQMGKAARQRIDEHFSWKIVGKRYAHLFDTYLES